MVYFIVLFGFIVGTVLIGLWFFLIPELLSVNV